MQLLVCGAPMEQALRFWGQTKDVIVQSVDQPASIADMIARGYQPDVIALRLLSAELACGQHLTQIRLAAPGVPVIAWIPEMNPESAFELSYLGMDALVTDGATYQQRSSMLERQFARRSQTSAAGRRMLDEPWRKHLVGNGSSMRVVCELIRLVSQRRCTVLISGETGSGKEMVARAIHAASPRASQPMVSINCNAIPNDLLEAELFGHVKGAYTGAFQNRIGRFEQANRGTLFLDEIGDLPFPLQAKLLRVLQEREIHRLGSSDTVKVDVRLIAATNANLKRLVEQGKFREDLYYRLHVAPIQVPPLRERIEDIPLLVDHFIQKICRNEQIPPKAVSIEIIEWLQSMAWPGNVRELENTIESAIAVNGNHPVLRLADFPTLLGNTSQMFAMPNDGIDYKAVVGRFERTLLSEALAMAGGQKKRAAALLQMKRTTFLAKLEALQISYSPSSDEDKEEEDADLDSAYFAHDRGAVSMQAAE